jgi:hypothetical protein
LAIVLLCVKCPAEDAPVIDSVEIVTKNVFDTSRPEENNFLFRLANAIHIVTRSSVIEKELLLGMGDVWDTALVNESERNIRSLPFIHSVAIELKETASKKNILYVETSDRWSKTGTLTLERTGGRSAIQIGIEESNFLGRAISIDQDYFFQEKEKDYYEAFVDSRYLFGRRLSGSFLYTNNPFDGRTEFTLEQPYRELNQRWSWELQFSFIDGRRDFYSNGLLAARYRYDGLTPLAAASYRTGPRDLKNTFSFLYRYVDRDFFDTISTSARSLDLISFPEDSVYHYGQVGWYLQQVDFREFRRLNRFSKIEDVNVGASIFTAAGFAYDPRSKTSPYQYWRISPRAAFVLGKNLVATGLSWQDWRDGDHIIQQRLNYDFIIYNQSLAAQTLIMNVDYVANRHTEGSVNLVLDEERGLRGYSSFALTGENRLVVNLEDRIFPGLEILTVATGAAVFSDIGFIWDRNRPLTDSQAQFAFGAGLRLGFTRTQQAEIVRIDMAYAVRRARLEISVGSGQFF